MKMQETTGKYKHNGQDITFTFSYPVYDANDIADDNVRSLAQRQAKVDAGNKARAKAQVANGHSKVVKQTEEQKAKAKLQRQADKAILQALKAKGIASKADLEGLLF